MDEAERDILIDRIVERVGEDKQKYYGKAVERFEVAQGVRVSSYWVTQIREGTTVGKRYPSLEEWEAARASAIRREEDSMRVVLEEMNDTQLLSQADYWLKE